jgi:hypothetical protein
MDLYPTSPKELSDNEILVYSTKTIALAGLPYYKIRPKFYIVNSVHTADQHKKLKAI